MITVKIENDEALNMLMDRLAHWTDNAEVQELFSKMYENYIEGGCFDGAEFDVMNIVDNDYVNYCEVIDEGDEDFEKIKKFYKENGCGDVSCEDVRYSYVEAADDEDDPEKFLVRY